MVRFYAENIFCLCRKGDEPHHATRPAAYPADRDVRHLGDARAARNQFFAIDRAERVRSRLDDGRAVAMTGPQASLLARSGRKTDQGTQFVVNFVIREV